MVIVFPDPSPLRHITGLNLAGGGRTPRDPGFTCEFGTGWRNVAVVKKPGSP